MDFFSYLRQKYTKLDIMEKKRTTPELITSLEPNEVFVFGSNLKGMHGGGAAYIAYRKFGAIMGQGVGLQGQSYGIPTMQGGVETIRPYVDEFIEFAEKTIKKVVNKQNAKISVTSTSYVDVCGLADLLPDGEKMPDAATYMADYPKSLGITLPAAVSFIGTSYDMTDDSYTMSGSMAVASSIVAFTYLWNEIRVQGGAYGAGMNSGRTGNISCYTYRDPNPARSLDKLRAIPDFLSDYTANKETDISGAIISTVGHTDPLLSPGTKGRVADEFYYSGYTFEDKLKFRKEILESTPEIIAEQRYTLDHMAEKSSICVVGPKETLETIPGLEIREL